MPSENVPRAGRRRGRAWRAGGGARDAQPARRRHRHQGPRWIRAPIADAIRHLDAGITVFSTATPRFVEIAEQGVRMAEGPIENYTSLASPRSTYAPRSKRSPGEYLEPLRRCDIDTLVLGCTHFPLLKALIGGVVGRDVTLISSAREAARDVSEILAPPPGLRRARPRPMPRVLHDGGRRGGVPQLRQSRLPASDRRRGAHRPVRKRRAA